MLPSGEWWEKVQPFLNLIKIKPPDTINGKQIAHPAHQADVARLNILIEHGGIYLDLDILCVKSFAPLLHHSFVLGQEGQEENSGLGNAVILAQQNSVFAKEWLRGFNNETSFWKGFRSCGFDSYWDEMSVKYPSFLATIFSSHIHIEYYESFFHPSYKEEDLERVMHLPR